MKRITTLCLLLCWGTLNAQTFEGSIYWLIKTEITDPKQKAKMDASQAKMNDSANQAKMKEMQAKMNDPQFKAMMEANPQMKAQMEIIMKGGDITSMFPTAMKLKIKGGNTLTVMEGGMAMEILYLKENDLSISLNRQNKTYTVLPNGGGPGTTPIATKPKVTKTSETAKILNYTCTKYIVERMENNKPITQVLWTTTEIKDIDMKSLARINLGRGNQTMSFEGVEGIRLKMEMTTPEMKITMEVTEIKREPLPLSDFSIADFKEVSTPYVK